MSNKCKFEAAKEEVVHMTKTGHLSGVQHVHHKDESYMLQLAKQSKRLVCWYRHARSIQPDSFPVMKWASPTQG